MKAVITGDIINSRGASTARWQRQLKRVLSQYGESPRDWEIYRGDSFQLVLNAKQALWAAIHAKAAIKQIVPLDIRMGIGLGKHSYKATKVTASTGSAFVNSGEAFDQLKKQALAISTGKIAIDEQFNLMLSLASLTMDSWSDTVAKVILTMIENPKKNQVEIAAKLKKSQSSISEALKRGGFDEIKQLIAYYEKNIATL